MNEGYEIRQMIGVEMGQHDAANIVLSETQLNKTICHAAAEVEDDSRMRQLDQHRRRRAAWLELACSGTQKNESSRHLDESTMAS
jgi:hypothetical protein